MVPEDLPSSFLPNLTHPFIVDQELSKAMIEWSGAHGWSNSLQRGRGRSPGTGWVTTVLNAMKINLLPGIIILIL